MSGEVKGSKNNGVIEVIGEVGMRQAQSRILQHGRKMHSVEIGTSRKSRHRSQIQRNALEDGLGRKTRCCTGHRE